MFEKGERIIYGSSGVCEVVDISMMDMSGTRQGKLYYTLIPVYMNGSKIYTPVDNQKIVMRKLLSKGEVMPLIDQIPDIEPLWIKDEKKREEVYKEALQPCTFEGMIRIIKTLYRRQRVRIENGKRLASLDERYMKMAEDSLYGELSISLDMEREKVAQYITGLVN